MVGIRRTEQTHSLIQSFSGARSALEEAFQYYKVGRHGETFLEKPYFLLSRCAHVLFSLWLAQQETERGFFCMAAPPRLSHSAWISVSSGISNTKDACSMGTSSKSI